MIGLGRILAETREARGVALEDVERETRIARRYLLALEEEDFGAFPAQVQARGFLRVYAQYLGLDSAEMLALFPNDSGDDS
ncbi:MAG: helix-turn-helix domain-containing protein, partial [Dehalococcoidia bacterium]